MAKPVLQISTKRLNGEPHALPDKREKQDGEIYILQECWMPPGALGIVGPGSKIVECMDGMFAIYNENGRKLFFRIGREVVESLNSIIKKNN